MTAIMKPKYNSFYLDLAFLYLVVAMLQLGEEAENGSLNDDGVVVEGAPSEHDQKITNKTRSLKQRLIATIKRNKKHENETKHLRELLVSRLIQCENKIVQLDYLAIHILSMRFSSSRKEKLHNRLQWIQNEENDLVSILSLLDKTIVSGRDKEMENIADFITNI